MKSFKMFYDANQYEFIQDIKSRYAEIYFELNAILDLPLRKLNEQTWAGERPNYLTSQFDPNLAWKTYVFKFFGISHIPNRESCPVISELIDKYPWIVTIEFSLLEPHTHIQPHRGYTDRLLRAHLGMIIPEGDAAIKVGEETKGWVNGDWIVFDDSVLHEAWNKTDEKRIVLMLDFEPQQDSELSKKVCEEILSKTNDKHMLDIAPNEEWLKWFEQGYFPIKHDERVL